MAKTLFDLVYATAVKLPGGLREGTATGGSTTTIIDTVGFKNLDNDYLNGGTAFIIQTTDALAPQGQYRVISDYVASTKTATVTPAFSATAGAGDMYGVMTSRYPLSTIIQKINEVLVSLPAYPVTDVANLATVLNKREYLLPATTRRDLRDVEIEEGTEGDTDDRRYTRVYNWDVIPATATTGELLRLTYDLPVGRILKLTYAEYHAPMRDYDDELEEVVHPDRIIFEAAAGLVQWYQDKSRTKDYKETLAMLQTLAERAKLNYPMPCYPSKPGKIALPWPYFGRR